MANPRPRHQPFLDIIRWGASWIVLLGHGRYLLFEGIQSVDNPGLVTKAIYLISGLQHEGVVMFFIVSGFLVGGSIWAAVDEGRFNGLDYMIKRAVRIYIVMLPALVLAWIILMLGEHVFADTRVFAVQPKQLITVQIVACHLAVMQGAICSVIASNAPLWSLSYEWILYLIAPLVLVACYAPVALIWRLTGLALLAASVYTLAPVFIQWYWFAFWAMGVISWRFLKAGGLPLWLGIAGLCGVALSCVISRLSITPVIVTDMVIASGLALAIANQSIMSWSPAPKLIEYLASFSFSLYVTHLPIATLTVALVERAGWPHALAQPGLASYAVYFFTIGVAIAFAAGFAWLTEDHTATARRYLLNSCHSGNPTASKTGKS